MNEDSNSSMETYPPSPRFDDALLELDDTHEFVTPAMVGEPQAVPAKEAESEFPQDEEDDWSNDGSLLSQVIDMQNRVEQRQQEDVLLQQQQQQQQQQQHKNKKRKQDTVSSSTSNSKRAKQKKQQHQQEKVSRTVPEPSTPPTGGVVADPREHGEQLGARRTLFPTPPTRRARATSAPSGSDIEGIAPIHQSAPRVADAQTQTPQNQDSCPLRERSYTNLAFELRAKENLYGKKPWQKVFSKSTRETSHRTYLVGGGLMLNHQLEKHSLSVNGGWLNRPNSSENNIPLQQHELVEVLDTLAQQDTTQPPKINKSIGDPEAKFTVHLVAEGGVLKISRRYRTIEVDISTPERFQQLKEDCLFALQVNRVLTERARQRRHLVEFLLRNPTPCECTGGAAAHVRGYYYSPRVSEYKSILPLEFVYKNLLSSPPPSSSES